MTGKHRHGPALPAIGSIPHRTWESRPVTRALSGSGEGLGRVIARGYSTALVFGKDAMWRERGGTRLDRAG